MSSNDIAVSVRGLSKSYTIAHNAEKHTTLSEAMLHRFKKPLQRAEKEIFWALRDLDFDIKKGDVVGIIGRNGAGKSTLLKILSQITEPTQGEIRLYGRVGSLLEVGTGFHPELTGRENIFLNGAILGMRKSEIQRQFDAIVDFAGVEKFLDTPVKRYSSGMYVRLAFAVAAHLSSEILIVDEVLAVGDAEFQKKCLGKMKDVSTSGRTVLFVSHNMNAIDTLCNSAIALKQGKVQVVGTVSNAVNAYFSESQVQSTADLSKHPNRPASFTPCLQQVRLMNADSQLETQFAAGDLVRITLDVRCSHKVADPRIGIGFTSSRGERLFAVATYLSESVVSTFEENAQVTVELVMPPLVPGRLHLDISLSDGDSKFLDEVQSAISLDVSDSNYLKTSYPYFSEMGFLLVKSQWFLEEMTKNNHQLQTS